MYKFFGRTLKLMYSVLDKMFWPKNGPRGRSIEIDAQFAQIEMIWAPGECSARGQYDTRI